MELTPSELTVLGLIIERPQHGYDLEQVIERRGIRQWTEIGFSSIYYLLAKLEKRGLVHAPDAPAGGKSRRIFHATAAGREVAARSALALIEELRPVPHPLLVGVSNLPLLSARQYARALRDRLAQVEARIAAVKEAESAQAPLVLAAREVFSFSLSLLEAERSWLAARAQVPMTDKVDFKREIDAYHAKRGRFHIVDVPDLRYLMIDGHGDPNTAAFADATEALYPLAYRLKFASKLTLGRDYVVMPLEGLWWADDMDAFTASRDKSQWDWTLMIMVPDWIDQDMFAHAVEQVAAKNHPRRLHEVRLATLSEGRCVQTLHVGSYDDEAEVLARMHHEFIPENGLRMVGKHHEIYLSDFRKVAPEKLRTILRQPVRAPVS